MNKFQQIYFDIISQQAQHKSQAKFANLLKMIDNNDVEEIQSKYDKFNGDPITGNSSSVFTDYEFPNSVLQKIQLTNGKYVTYLKINGDIDVGYDWHPAEAQTWDYPGCAAGIDSIGPISYPFSKNLNDKNNDKCFQLTICDFNDNEKEIKFSELSTQDKNIIISEIMNYFESDEFYQELEQKLTNQQDDYDDYDYDDRW